MRQLYDALPWVRSAADPEIVRLFAQYGTPVFYKKGSIIIPRGESNTKIALVRKGIVGRAIYNESMNKHTATAMLVPGRLLGISHFMARRPNNVYVRAIRDAMLTELPFEVLESHMKADYKFTLLVMKQFCTDLESDLEGLSNITFFKPEYNLICLLYAISEAYGADMESEWIRLPLKLSYNEMAMVIYTTRVTAIRIVNTWRAADKYRVEGNERYFHRSLLDKLVDWKKPSFV